MFQNNTPVRKSSIEATIIVDDGMPTIGPGTLVAVKVPFYGKAGTIYTWQIGKIERIGLSPYYPECNEGVQRAYVIGAGWTDYLLEEEIVLAADLCDCEKCDSQYPVQFMCAECGHCSRCCECSHESEAEEEEETDYQPPRFLWMGKWFPG
jgi:hypothetical protein